MTNKRLSKMRQVGPAGQGSVSRSLGNADPRLRRNAQAALQTDQRLGGPLDVENDGRATVRVAGPVMLDSDGAITLRAASNEMGPPVEFDVTDAAEVALAVQEVRKQLYTLADGLRRAGYLK